MTLKKIRAYSKPHNFKILRNKMNEKAGSEIMCKHVQTCDLRNSKNNHLDNNQYDN